MVAVGFLALSIAAALVLDFGVVRAGRTANKAATDAAVTAGIRSLEAADGTHKPFVAACAALAYLRVNAPAFTASAGSWRTGAGAAVSNPCTSPALLAQTCVPSTSSSWAWYRDTVGTRTVDIKTGYVLPPPDAGVSAAGGCDQLAVTIQEVNQPGLGRLATSANTVVSSTSVARVGPSSNDEGVPALVLLERLCQAVLVGGTASIEVKGYLTAPGSIHADSNGSCPSAPSTKVLSGGQPQSIKALKAEQGAAPGVITEVALSGSPGAVPGNAYDQAANIFAEGSVGPPVNGPTGRGLVGRGAVDKRYLAPVKTAIADAGAQWSATPPTGPTTTTLTGGQCNNITRTIDTPTVYFVCPTADISAVNLRFATLVVFTGKILIAPNRSLTMPLAQRVYVKGVNGISIDNSGTFTVKDSGAVVNTAGDRVCPAEVSATRAKLVVGQGSIANAGAMRLCDTAVIMADLGTTPGGCPLPASATSPGPAPYDNNCQGSVTAGSNSSTSWSAPNVTDAPTTDYTELEDLALWTETSTGNNLGGGGKLVVSGVFYAPNANAFALSGGSSSTQPANAQFVVRRLSLTGNAPVSMRPNPSNGVSVPAPTQYSLVR
jgi:hypothetical protein